MPPPLVTTPRPLRELATRAVYQHYGNKELRKYLPKSVVTDVITAQPGLVPMGVPLERPGQMHGGITVRNVLKNASCQNNWYGETAWNIVCAFIPTGSGMGAALGYGISAGYSWGAVTGMTLFGACVCTPVTATAFGGCLCAFIYSRDFMPNQNPPCFASCGCP